MKQWVYIPKSGEEYRKAVLLASQAGLTIIDSSSCGEISAEVLFRMMPVGVIVFERTSRKIDGYREIGFEDFILMLDDGRDREHQHSKSGSVITALNSIIDKQEMTNVLLAELVEIFSEGDREQDMGETGYQPQSLDD